SRFPGQTRINHRRRGWTRYDSFPRAGENHSEQLLQYERFAALWALARNNRELSLRSFCVMTWEMLGSDGMRWVANTLNSLVSHLSTRPLLRLTNRLLYH